MSINEVKWKQWDSVQASDGVALVTGARIKIGYQIALRLLRSGMTVIAVTRFPNVAALRYMCESDFGIWKNNLHIYGVDLRHLPSVQQFIGHIIKRYSRLDILINNAAQTIRRPRAYYSTIIENERTLLSNPISLHAKLIRNVGKDPYLLEWKKEDHCMTDIVESGTFGNGVSFAGFQLDRSLPLSSALTLVPLLPCDELIHDEKNFPPGGVDEHSEPQDLRDSTSWNQTADEISMVEMVEVQTINSTVPFMLVSQLLPLMKQAVKLGSNLVITHPIVGSTRKAKGVEGDTSIELCKLRRAFIVNVTSAEGLFSNKRSGVHPHTNMAKAALNMMTKSIASQYAAMNIFTTAVDTGWVTKMKPTKALRPRERPPTVGPLSEKDGATRVLDPIFGGMTSSKAAFGTMFQNYEETEFF